MYMDGVHIIYSDNHFVDFYGIIPFLVKPISTFPIHIVITNFIAVIENVYILFYPMAQQWYTNNIIEVNSKIYDVSTV